MIKNIKYILPIIIASAIILSAHISFAEETVGNNLFPEGKAPSASFSPTPAMIAEEEKQQTEFLIKEDASSNANAQIVEQGLNPSQYPITLSEKVSMLVYAVIAGFVWLTIITAILFKKRERE